MFRGQKDYIVSCQNMVGYQKLNIVSCQKKVGGQKENILSCQNIVGCQKENLNQPQQSEYNLTLTQKAEQTLLILTSSLLSPL